MSSTKKDEARKEVNNAIINSSSSDINRMLDAAKSSREKREQSKREREAREAALKERKNLVSERTSFSIRMNTNDLSIIRVVGRAPADNYTRTCKTTVSPTVW